MKSRNFYSRWLKEALFPTFRLNIFSDILVFTYQNNIVNVFVMQPIEGYFPDTLTMQPFPSWTQHFLSCHGCSDVLFKNFLCMCVILSVGMLVFVLLRTDSFFFFFFLRKTHKISASLFEKNWFLTKHLNSRFYSDYIIASVSFLLSNNLPRKSSRCSFQGK